MELYEITGPKKGVCKVVSSRSQHVGQFFAICDKNCR